MEWYQLNQTDILSLLLFDSDVHPTHNRPTYNDYINAFDLGFEFYALKEISTSINIISTFQLLMIDNHTTLLAGVGVHPIYRHAGYGKKIINTAIEKSNTQDLICHTDIDNYAMNSLLNKFNFNVDTYEGTKIIWKKILE